MKISLKSALIFIIILIIIFFLIYLIRFDLIFDILGFFDENRLNTPVLFDQKLTCIQIRLGFEMLHVSIGILPGIAIFERTYALLRRAALLCSVRAFILFQS